MDPMLALAIGAVMGLLVGVLVGRFLLEKLNKERLLDLDKKADEILKSARENADLKTKEADDKFELMRATCAHDGGFSNPSQNAIVSPGAIMVLSTTVCKKCGYFITNQTVIETGHKASGIAVPQIKMS